MCKQIEHFTVQQHAFSLWSLLYKIMLCKYFLHLRNGGSCSLLPSVVRGAPDFDYIPGHRFRSIHEFV